MDRVCGWFLQPHGLLWKQHRGGWEATEPAEAREKAIETHGQNKWFDANFSK